MVQPIMLFCCCLVLQGLMEVRSPYLEELLSLLMTTGAQSGTAGSVATLISLLLQESEEGVVKKEADSNKWASWFYFPLQSCRKTLIFDRTKWQTRLLLTKIAKQGLKSVVWYSETAAGFGWERFNWFCRLDIGLTDWLSVKITEHFSKSTLPWVHTTPAVMACTHWIDSFCHTQSGTKLASGLWEQTGIGRI